MTGLSPGSALDSLCVSPQSVKELWPHVAPFIRNAMVRGDLGLFSTIEADVLENRALLWIAWRKPHIEAAAVTQIIKTECSKVCMVRACGGVGVNNWIGVLAKIEDHARQEGCDCVRVMGRKGWARLLKDYRTTRIVLERRL